MVLKISLNTTYLSKDNFFMDTEKKNEHIKFLLDDEKIWLDVGLNGF